MDPRLKIWSEIIHQGLIMVPDVEGCVQLDRYWSSYNILPFRFITPIRNAYVIERGDNKGEQSILELSSIQQFRV